MIYFYRSCLALALVFFSLIAGALPTAISDNINEDARWLKWSSAIQASNFSLSLEESGLIRKSCVTQSCTTDFDTFLLALVESYDDRLITKTELKKWLEWSAQQPLAVEERAQLFWTYQREFPGKWAQSKRDLKKSQSEEQLVGHELSARFEQMLQYASEHESIVPVPIDANRTQIARDLVTLNPPIDQYGDGSYAKGLRLYMFCRDDRHYSCLMIMRNPLGEIVKSGSQVWTHKSLGFSRVEKKFNQVNGHTPTGVFLVDGVMPVADQQLLFGKFRRLVLNLPEASPNEEKLKTLLPVSSHKANWWKEAVIARNMGRGLFRVHGTLRPAPTGTTYFPFLGTGGCIAQRENTYNKVTYQDQRQLLDDLMTNLGLRSEFENETQIKGLLYVINLDGTKKAVEIADLVKAKVLN